MYENTDKFYYYKTNLYESNFKLLNRLLTFKWNLIFNNIEEDAYKLVVDGYKITVHKSKLKLKKDFIQFIEKLVEFFEDNNNNDYNFEINIKDEYFNETLLNNWKIYLEIEDKNINMIYNVKTEENKVLFKISISKFKKNKNKYENILKLLKFIIQIKDNYVNDNNINEFILENIIHKRFNMINLFPERVKERIKFSYHIIPQINKSKLKIIETKEYYTSKIDYKTLILRNCNDEEILFGQKIKPYLEELFNVNEKDNEIKIIPVFFGNILKNLLKNNDFTDKIKLFFSKCDLLIYDLIIILNLY